MLTPNLAHRKLAAAVGNSSSTASSPSGSPLHINKSIVNSVKAGSEKIQKQGGGSSGGSLNRNLTLPKQYFKQRFGSKKLANKSSSTQIGDDKASPRLASSSLSNSISGTTNTTYSTSSSSSSSSFSKDSSTMINNRFDPVVNDDSVSNNEKLVAVHVDNLLRSVKYLEQIVLKNKYEIVGSTVTAILESVVDLYNQIRSFGAASNSLSQSNSYYNSQLVEYSGQLHVFKSNINQTLADLVKWSDKMFLSAVDKTNQTVIDTRVQENSSNQLNKILVAFLKSLNDLVDFYKSQSDELNSSTSKQLTNTSNNSDVGQLNKLVMRKRPTSISSFDHSHRLLFSPSGSSSISSNFSTSTTSNQARPPSQHLNSSQPSQNLLLSSIAQPVITVSAMNEGNKTIELKTSRNFVSPSDASTTITQTNTLITTRMIGKNGSDTTTTVFSSVKNGENNIFIKENDILDLSAFMDIDKLAVELSQSTSIRPTMTNGDTETVGSANLASTLNNDTCNYLVEKFETFARDFSNKKLKEERERREIVSEASRSYSRASRTTKSPSPMPGTPVSKTTIKSPLMSSFKKSFSPAGSPSANSYSPSRVSSSAPTDRIVTTLYKKSTVKHDLDNKSSYIESKEKNNKESVISRVVDETVQNDTSFVEENSVNDKKLAKLVLDVEPEDGNDDQVVATGGKKSDDTDSIDNECDSTAIHRILLDENNSKYHKSHLRPNFLVIKDEFDENYEIGGCGDSDDEYKLVTKGNSQDDAEIFDLVIIEKKNRTKELDDDEEEYDYDLDDYKDDIKIKNKEESVRISKQESSIIKSNSLSTTASLSNSSLSESMLKQSQPAPASPNTQSPKSIMKSTPSRVADSNDKIDILGMLDVTHLLEYQLASNTSGSSSISSSSYTSLNTSYLSNVSHSTCDMSLLRGGNVDALVVLATSSHLSIKTVTQVNNSPQIAPRNSKLYNCKDALGNNKNNFLFQEAFLTTYRTIMEPIELVEKLIYRYRKFAKNKSSPSEIVKTNLNFQELDDRFDMNRLKINNKYNRMALLAARNSLTLLVRVIDDLENNVDHKLVKTLLGFIAELVVDDELQIARLLRKKLLNKLDGKRIDQATKEKTTSRSSSKANDQTHIPASSAPSSPIHTIDTIRSVPRSPQILPYLNSLTKRCFTLLDFRSSEIAEQMTLVDLNLFSRIELPEVLLWSTKQSEQYSPNLIRFTEHFNSISYWARSRILEHETYKDREKYLLKFVKIMKHLRKLNNFNSYLSILSAVDSGPIQRLDWPKVIIDEIQELSQLVDPKCGFKMLREAIAQSQPPCIPHIGLILQDLTMLHIANPDYLPSGNCNFWKRWQQYNILERLRYFKRCNYGIKPNSKIQELFNDFKDFIGEDAQYNISEQLKPRTKPTTTFNS